MWQDATFSVDSYITHPPSGAISSDVFTVDSYVTPAIVLPFRGDTFSVDAYLINPQSDTAWQGDVFSVDSSVAGTNPTEIYVWDGTSWVHQPFYHWNGSTWTQIT